MDAFVERGDERDNRFERELAAIEAVLVHRLVERFSDHLIPRPIDVDDALAYLGIVPAHRLQLVPYFRVAARFVFVEVTHRGAPLLDERPGRRVHLALPDDEPVGVALEHLQQQFLHRAEVVVDQAVVEPCLFGELARRDGGVADADEQALGRVEEGLLCIFARRRDADALALCRFVVISSALVALLVRGSQSWYRVRCHKGEQCEHRQRDADRHDNAIAAGCAFSTSITVAEDAHPRQVRHAGGEHHEHERPAAPQAEQRVTKTDPRAVGGTALIVARQIHARVAARAQAGVLQRGELVDSRDA